MQMAPQTVEWLEARIVAYDLLRHLYLRPPTADVLAMIRPLQLATADVAPAMREGLELMQGVAADETALPTLAAEYTRLFVGPVEVFVPPFESCYRTGNSLVMQEVTTSVRRAYIEARLLMRRLHSDPDDHVGAEWEFLYALSTKASQAVTVGNVTEGQVWLSRRQAFLQDHLLRWGPQLCERLLASLPDPFFKGLALFTQGFLMIEAEELEEGAPDEAREPVPLWGASAPLR